VALFDRARIAQLLASAGEQLRGEWVLAGGAAATAWFTPGRTTEDIDITALDGSNATRVALMDFADSLGLPVEVVNSTIDYFLRRIPDWREHLVVLHRGPNATVYRPDATLFLLLKIRRLSQADHDDCIALLDHCGATGEGHDAGRVVAAIDALPDTDDPDLVTRRASLRGRLG